MPEKRLRLGIQISGRGSNMQALIAAASDPAFPAEVALVISNKADAAGLQKASAAGILTKVIPHRDFSSREEFDKALDAEHRNAGVDLICNAGFMRVLSPWFVDRWRGRSLNIHPSLLPSFAGTDVHGQVLRSGVRFSGCTVHYVDDGVDQGPIIVQAVVPVLAGDDEDTLATRVLTAEHKAYPLAVRLIAEGRVKIEGNRTLVLGDAQLSETLMLLNPS